MVCVLVRSQCACRVETLGGRVLLQTRAVMHRQEWWERLVPRGGEEQEPLPVVDLEVPPEEDADVEDDPETDVEEWLPFAQSCSDAPPAWAVPLPSFVPADAEVRPKRRW